MSLIDEYKKVLVGHIKTSEANSLLGSCIPCKRGDELFIITCGHVLYNDDWSELRYSLKELKVEIDSHVYQLTNILGTLENTQKTDLSIVKIDKDEDGNTQSFIELSLLEVKDNTFLAKSMMCVYPEMDTRPQVFDDIKYAGNAKDYEYSVRVDKNAFHDLNLGGAGASRYKGISGSGLFYQHNEELYLQGVIKAIPEISVNSEVDLVSVRAIGTIWENAVINSSVKKSHRNLHHNSPLNSEASRIELAKELLNQVSDKRYKVLICAPSDISSSDTAKTIYSQLIQEFTQEKIKFLVGGGKGRLVPTGTYPHLEEQDFIESEECSSLVIIADDHSTFSQLSLLSSSIFNSRKNKEVYIFYEDSVITTQNFIREGPFKFAEDKIKARVYEFSNFNDSMIKEVISGISSLHTCLGRIA